MAALHADVRPPARLAAKKRYQEVGETFPLPRPPTSEQSDKSRILLKTVVEAINDCADSAPTTERRELVIASRYRNP